MPVLTFGAVFSILAMEMMAIRLVFYYTSACHKRERRDWDGAGRRSVRNRDLNEHGALPTRALLGP